MAEQTNGAKVGLVSESSIVLPAGTRQLSIVYSQTGTVGYMSTEQQEIKIDGKWQTLTVNRTAWINGSRDWDGLENRLAEHNRRKEQKEGKKEEQIAKLQKQLARLQK